MSINVAQLAGDKVGFLNAMRELALWIYALLSLFPSPEPTEQKKIIAGSSLRGHDICNLIPVTA